MPADTMELAYGVIGEIGADVADITIPGEPPGSCICPAPTSCCWPG